MAISPASPFHSGVADSGQRINFGKERGVSMEGNARLFLLKNFKIIGNSMMVTASRTK
jgi:hypothetical protein